MAIFTIKDLAKAKYKQVFIDKIRAKEPMLLENTKAFEVLECPESVLSALEAAKTNQELTDIVKSGGSLKFLFKTKKGKRIKLTDISKENVKGSSARVGDANTTKYQELCSLYILEMVIKNKVVEKTKLVEIYNDLVNQPTWQESFLAQEEIFKKMKTDLKIGRHTIFNRDGGFMDFITQRIKTFGFSQKDAWNPADVWLIKNSTVIQDLKEAKSIQELNDIMKKMFFEDRLIGISLKKTKKKAFYELVNLSNEKPKEYKLLKLNIAFDMVGNKFSNDELNYDQYYDGKSVINVQIRMYPKSTLSNVQVSYKLKGASAEFGKVPSRFRNDLFKTFTGLNFPQGKSMPRNLEEFSKNRTLYEKMFKKIQANKNFNTNVRDVNEFFKNFETIFSEQSETYIQTELCTKLQGFHIAYGFSLLSENELTDLLTQWAYLSQKKGNIFGPFVKVY